MTKYRHLFYSVLFILSVSCSDSNERVNKQTEEVTEMDNSYNNLLESFFDYPGKINWGKVYTLFFLSKEQALGLEFDQLDVLIRRPSSTPVNLKEYRKVKLFDLISLKGVGNADSEPFVYMKQTADSIILRTSDDIQNPVGIYRTGDKWILDHTYLQRDISGCQDHSHKHENVYSRVVALISDSTIQYINESYDSDFDVECAVGKITRDSVTHREFDMSNRHLVVKRGLPEFISFALHRDILSLEIDPEIYTKPTDSTRIYYPYFINKMDVYYSFCK